MNVIKKTALYFAEKKFCRQAILEKADLSAFAEKPSKSVMTGMVMIALSYVSGVPAVVALGLIAVWMKQPLIGIVGGILIYAMSTIIFFIGIKLAGKEYFMAFLRWLTRVTLETLLGGDVRMISGGDSGDACSRKP